MSDYVSVNGQKLLQRAVDCASRAGAPQVEPVHIFRALVSPRPGLNVAKAVLQRLDVDTEALWDWTFELTQNRFRQGGNNDSTLDWSPDCNAVMQFAYEEAAAFGGRYVGGEHMLLGILHLDAEPCAMKLKDCGVSLEAVRTILQQIANPQEE